MSVDKGSISVDHPRLGKRFIRLPLEALRDPALSPRALAALAILLHYDFCGRGYPGHAAACAEFGWARRTYLHALEKLDRTGWLQRGPAVPGATLSLTIPHPERWRGPSPATPRTVPVHPAARAGAVSALPPVREPASLSQTLQERLKDPDFRTIWEAISDVAKYACQHPADEEARRAMREICAPQTQEQRLRTIAAYERTLTRIRQTSPAADASALRPAPESGNMPA